MPYITEDRKTGLPDLKFTMPKNPGELNYIITRLIHGYAQRGGLNYQKINDVLGALEGAKAEFYRRVAVPYEDRKIETNGDVYD